MDPEQIIAELQKDQVTNLGNLRTVESELNAKLKEKLLLENKIDLLRVEILDWREKVKQAKFVCQTNDIEIKLKTAEYWQNKNNRG